MKRGMLVWPAGAGLILAALVAAVPFGGERSSGQGAAGTLVPNADKSNNGDWKNHENNTCGFVPCYEALDEDIDSPNDGDFVYSLSDPMERGIEFELGNAPADLATLTGVTVRFRAFKQGSKSASALIEVFRLPEILLGPASPQTLDESATTYSYSISGISLDAQQVDGLFVRVTGDTIGAGTPTTVRVSAINIDTEYVSTATSSPTASPTETATATATATALATETATATATETATATATATETATATPEPSPTETATATATETATATATETATATATETATATATATATETATDTPSPTPTATATPSATPSPSPTPSPVPPPANDNFADAAVVPEPLPFTDSVLVAGATLENLEPQPATCGPVDFTVWYSFAPAQDRAIRITTSGSTYDTVIAVYTGDPLTEVGCNDDTGGDVFSGLGLAVTSNTTYWIQIGSLDLSPVQLNVRFEAGAAPANDNFADAIAASQLPYADTIGTFGATGEAGEPDLCIGQFPIIGSTVWYRVEVTELSAVTVTTQGSDFDTVLGVYTGSTVGALTRVVCNDDANQQVLTSEVQFSAASGTTYWIQAGGFSGDTGALTLTVTRQSLGYYHAVAPYRILDTRSGPPGKVGADAEISVDVTGTGGASGVPATDVSAVVINTTVTEPTASSYLTVYPSLESRPFTSNLNFVAGQTVGNLVTVKVGTDGNVAVYNVAGETHVIFDVVGWYGAEAGGSLFNGLTPKRILDTRNGTGVPAAAKVGADTSITVDVTDPLGFGVPADATAVVVNAAVAEATNASYLTVYPSDLTTPPLASNLNFVAGQTVVNLVAVKVGADGNVMVYNAAGQTHVIFDVLGWYGGPGDLFHPLSPVRILDTRSSPQGSPPGRVGPNAEISADVTTGSVPGTATGVIVNTTATEATAQSYLTVYSSDVTTKPLASNLNFVTGQTVGNLVIVEVGADGNVKVYNAAGQVHVIFDAVGYFGP